MKLPGPTHHWILRRGAARPGCVVLGEVQSPQTRVVHGKHIVRISLESRHKSLLPAFDLQSHRRRTLHGVNHRLRSCGVVLSNFAFSGTPAAASRLRNGSIDLVIESCRRG